MFEGAGVGGDAHVGEGGRRQHGTARVGGLSAQAEGISGLAFVVAPGLPGQQVGGDAVDELGIGHEQGTTNGYVLGSETGVSVQLRRDVETLGVDHLVSRGLFRVRREAVVLEGVAGEAGDVLNGQMNDGVFGHGGVTVSHDPSFVEVGGAFSGNLRGNFVKWLGPARGHREGYRDLLLGEVTGRQRVDAARPFRRRLAHRVDTSA